jgi:hypothetical protein
MLQLLAELSGTSWKLADCKRYVLCVIILGVLTLTWCEAYTWHALLLCCCCDMHCHRDKHVFAAQSGAIETD